MWEVTERGTRLVVTSSDAEGKPVMLAIPMTDFMKRVAREGPPIREEIWDHEIRVNDNLATAWVSYNLFVDDKIDHCGEDTFQLFRGKERWIIVAIADTQRRHNCELPQ